MGDFLPRPIKTKDSEDDANERFAYGASAMQGWRRRQEDSHIAALAVGKNKDIQVFGVFDGHGGKEVSAWIKKHFVEELEKNKNFQAGNYKEALEENFIYMDKLMVTPENKEELNVLKKISDEDDQRQNKDMGMDGGPSIFEQIYGKQPEMQRDVAMGTGCTACVALVAKDTIYFANAGDSRAVVSKQGKAYAMTIDHKPDNDTEKARIYKANGYVTDGRIMGNLNLSRSLGDLEYKVPSNYHPKEQMITPFPEVTTTRITADTDFFIVACDGIWDCKTNQEAVSFVEKRLKTGKGAKISKTVEALLDDCIAEDVQNSEGIGCDNMTCVVIEIKK